MVYPKLLEQLDKLPPKKLIIWSNKPSEVVKAGTAKGQDLGDRLRDNMKRIGTSEFTGRADLEKVPKLYKRYVEELVVLLPKSFAAYQQSPDEDVRLQLPPPPADVVESGPELAKLQLSMQTPVFLLPDYAARQAGGRRQPRPRCRTLPHLLWLAPLPAVAEAPLSDWCERGAAEQGVNWP